MKSNFVQYYVEGEDEEKLLHVLISSLNMLRAGKVHKFNPVAQELTELRLRALSKATMVVLVFDTDAGNPAVLMKNIKTLQGCPSVSEIVLIPQVCNLEDELVRSCNIRKTEELLGSKSKGGFKRDLLRVSNLGKKLLEHQFDIGQFWSKEPHNAYEGIRNQSEKVKLCK